MTTNKFEETCKRITKQINAEVCEDLKFHVRLMKPSERVLFFESMSEGYCICCGEIETGDKICKCGHRMKD